jgi:hypothetical protein
MAEWNRAVACTTHDGERKTKTKKVTGNGLAWGGDAGPLEKGPGEQRNGINYPSKSK